ncbi:putative receptor-like protein kinase At4g00960 [Juglans microcarpa x Juglans regia]|uniref:putative receptor-like protein kinase At4g00960 n=1 Tax=Juglans microcarpa x Juglans regia TaxID=2249226 RepID=UPI001B7EFAAB|nr:putative receptor-like protein kinase At4g00960 [Juglans microcarpa x Juglans regia]
MCCSRLLFFTCLILILHLFAPTLAQLVPYACSDKGNYTSNSTYRANLNTVLASMSSNTNISYGFYNFSVGENSGKVNAIALCRGDIGTDDCRSCVNASSQDLLQKCPDQKEAIIYYTECMVRYSNRYIFGVLEGSPFPFSSILNASDVDAFTQVLGPLLGRLKKLAAAGNSTRKFAVGSETAQDFQTIHALLMCTPDLDELDCKSCLEQCTAAVFSSCCYGRQGGRYVSPSCELRYETYSFYDPTAEAPPPSLLPPSRRTKGKESKPSRTTVVIIVLTIGFALLIVSNFVFYLRVRKSRQKVKSEARHEISSVHESFIRYDFGTIRVATENFSEVNKLGEGGFGAVYKGKLQNGLEIAVKRLSMGSSQGNIEFENEVLLLARLQHRNLLSIMGFCFKGNERLLIYEFMPNASLDHFLFDPIKQVQLNWEKRHKIIEGIARGLLYLHEDSRHCIIHRDLKASNILLDAYMNPKISDFGTARLLDRTEGNTMRIIGTYGYMSPEYAQRGTFSTKSDVFSFGVLILEMVSGHKNSSFPEGLASYAWENWRQGTPLNLVDPTLMVYSTIQIQRCIHIGLLCVQENVNDRPTTASVVLMLGSESITLAVPKRPAFLLYTSSTGPDMSSRLSYQSSNNNVQASVNDASITEQYPR